MSIAAPPRLRTLCSALILAATAGSIAPSVLGAQHAQHGASGTAPRIGLVVVAHGANREWNDRVRETVAAVAWPHGPMKVAFLMGSDATTASWDSATVQLQRDSVAGIIAVPFMVSSYGSHVRQIQFYAGAIPELPKELAGMGHEHGGHSALKVPVRVTRALDDAPELGEALFARWSALPAAERRRPVMLIAHGPNDADDAVLWERDILATAASLRASVAPQTMRLGLLRDDAPAAVRAAAVASLRDTIAAMSVRARDSVTVLPVLISTGSVNTVKIPADIAGLPVSYRAVGLSPHPALARWIGRIAGAELAAAPHAWLTSSSPAHAPHK